MEHCIEWVENRKWKTDHYYKLVHWHKRDFASIISNRTQTKYDKEWFDYYFEAIAVILLIVSLFLYLLSATYLLKPFYQDDEPTKEQLIWSAVYTRRVQIPGAFMIFWAIGFLILLKLEYSIATLAYSMVAFGAPILWLGLRRIAQIKF